jgi:hypothetical protein
MPENNAMPLQLFHVDKDKCTMNDISINIDCSDFRSVKEKFLYDINETNFLEGALANISVKISARTSARPSLVMRPPAFGKPLTLRMMQVFFNIQQQKAGSPDVAETEIGAGQSLVFALKHGRTAKQPGPPHVRSIQQASIARHVKRLPPQTASVPACGIAFCGRECAVRPVRLRHAVFTSQQPSPLEV